MCSYRVLSNKEYLSGPPTELPTPVKEGEEEAATNTAEVEGKQEPAEDGSVDSQTRC